MLLPSRYNMSTPRKIQYNKDYWAALTEPGKEEKLEGTSYNSNLQVNITSIMSTNNCVSLNLAHRVMARLRTLKFRKEMKGLNEQEMEDLLEQKRQAKLQGEHQQKS